jgi:hypothetical protein
MIRVDHLPLPEGLDAVARMTAPGELSVVVSDLLAPSEQRVAVRAAVRSARLRSWEFGVAPVPLAAGLAVPGVVRHLLASLRAHAVATAITGSLTAAAATAAAVLIVAAPPAHPHHSASGPPAAYPQAPAARSSVPAGPRAGARPGNSSAGQPPGSKQRVVTVATPGKSPRPTPQPSPTASNGSPPAPPSPTTSPVTSSPPAPQPTPTGTSSSPPPSSGGGKTCIILLGVTVCL